MPVVREYLPNDSAQVNDLALLAFEQFKDSYHDWPGFRVKIGNMSALADVGELIVAEAEGQIVGAVAYVGPGVPKAEFFRQSGRSCECLSLPPIFAAVVLAARWRRSVSAVPSVMVRPSLLFTQTSLCT
jgi:hypothetical protein